MAVKCNAKDCRYNSVGICAKDKIEISKSNAYDTNSAECIDYEK